MKTKIYKSVFTVTVYTQEPPQEFPSYPFPVEYDYISHLIESHDWMPYSADQISCDELEGKEWQEVALEIDPDYASDEQNSWQVNADKYNVFCVSHYFLQKGPKMTKVREGKEHVDFEKFIETCWKHGGEVNKIATELNMSKANVYSRIKRFNEKTANAVPEAQGSENGRGLNPDTLKELSEKYRKQYAKW